MDKKIFVNKGERAFLPHIVCVLDNWAAARSGKHVVDCSWFSGVEGARWTEDPVSIYYAGRERQGGGFTNAYFGLTASGMVFNADRIEEIRFAGLVANGEFIFSRWRHDFRSFSFGGPSVDGGLDYFRAVGDMGGVRRAIFAVRDGDFVEIT